MGHQENSKEMVCRRPRIDALGPLEAIMVRWMARKTVDRDLVVGDSEWFVAKTFLCATVQHSLDIDSGFTNDLPVRRLLTHMFILY